MPLPTRKKGEAKEDFISRCMRSKNAISEFPNVSQRRAVCESLSAKRDAKALSLDSDAPLTHYNSVTTELEDLMPNKVLVFRCEVGEPEMRIFKGNDHVVIPVIGLIEGVIQASNSPIPEFISESELIKTVSAWNGQPVVVDHPEVRGEKVSANSPDILEAEQIGQVFNAHVNDKKLKLEAWINVEGTSDKEKRITKAIDALKSGDMVEISTGFLAETRDESGEFEGKHFEGTLHNIIPDHLAILSKAKGACSIEGGCGANRLNDAHTDCKCGTIPCSCEHDDTNETKVLAKDVAKAISTFFTNELSDEDRRHALQRALDEKIGGEDLFAVVIAVFSKSVVYLTAGGLFRRAFKISEDGSVTLDDEITAVRPETEFVPVKTNEEMTDMDKTEKVKELITNESTQFTEDDRDWLMSLEADQLTRMAPVLLEESENDDTPGNADEEDTPNEDDDSDSAEGSTPTEPEEPVTAEQFIAAAPPEVAEVLNQGLRLQEANRSALISRIASSPNNTFSNDELTAFGTEQLEKLATLSAVPDYSGQGGPRANSEDPDAVPAPPEAFPMPAADAA